MSRTIPEPMTDNTVDRLTTTVTQLLQGLVPGYVGCTLGGSHAQGLQDADSDVEMYFYGDTHVAVPDEQDLADALISAGAQHRRSPRFLWSESPWGPHSFFVLRGQYFEVGYRSLTVTEIRVQEYQSGSVAPQRDFHDLGLGYMPSGLAASVVAENVLDDPRANLAALKARAAGFPKELAQAIRGEYWDCARYLVANKLPVAAARSDWSAFSAAAGRVVRNLFVMAFSLSAAHFPGDKWNAQLLRRTGWEHAEPFLMLLEQESAVCGVTAPHLAQRLDLLRRAMAMIESSLPPPEVIP